MIIKVGLIVNMVRRALKYSKICTVTSVFMIVLTFPFISILMKIGFYFDKPNVIWATKRNTVKEKTLLFVRNSNVSVGKLAYGFYAVSKYHLVAALVNIERLKEKRLTDKKSKVVDFVILTNINISKVNTKLFEDVKLVKYPKLPTSRGYYYESMVKLIFYNMTDYYRIIFLDTDALVLKSLDELFDLPSSVSLASPVAYWENELYFTSALLVIKPNHTTWFELSSAMNEAVEKNKKDMDLINEFYDRRITDSFKIYPDILLLPGYFVVLSSHFRDKQQSYYKETVPVFQNIENLVDKTYIVHFSGQPKPWDLPRTRLLAYHSISKYFFDFNQDFMDAFNEIRRILEVK